jgi:subtilisin family serine protease
MLIAVLDAGFQSVPVMSCFSQAISQNRITGVYDFAQSENDVYNNSSTHGSLVLSCMAGNIEGEYVGTAPDANYQLYISEVAATEYLVEEDYWVSAAEMADSAGADVINTSLGYSLFDDTLMNHSYADMDGNSTRISIGTDIAVSKGMICVNSAGNSGNNSWFYITAPADADSVLTVGAVGPDRMYASFSSKGPSYDGRVKPNVATQGYQAQVYWPGNFSGAGSGTSFSSPIMAGLAACLWQAFPDKKNMEIVKAIEQSASQYNTPDSLTGYGIPDMRKAYYILDGNTNTEDEIEVILMQNLFDNYSWLQLYSSQAKQITLEIIDARGRKVHIYNVNLIAGEYNRLTLNGLMNILSPGMYFLNIKAEGYTKTEKFIKR